MPGPKKMHGQAKPKNIKKALSRLFTYLNKEKGKLIIVTICIILSSLVTVVESYFIKPLLNDYVIPFIGQENVDFTSLYKMIETIIIIFAVGTIATYISSRLMVNVTNNTLARVRKDMFSHMEKLPLSYFDGHNNGEIMSMYTNDTDALREMLSNGITQVISSAISIVGMFIMMLILSPPLTFTILFMIIIMVIVVRKIGSKSGYYFKKQQDNIGKVNGYIEEMIEGQKVVKVFCHEDTINSDFEKLNNELQAASNGANKYANILRPIVGNIGNINYVVTSIVGGFLAIRGFVDLGTIGAFLKYSKSFSMPITEVSEQFNSILLALAGCERIFDFLDKKEEVDEGKVTLVNIEKTNKDEIIERDYQTGSWAWKIPHRDGTYTYTELKGDVKFEDVSFQYVEGKEILHNINIYANPGEKIAFVGSTGAGKTTITNLINRFYDISNGTILYDGINVKKIKKADLRRSLSIVLQDTHLFTGTVKDNIRFGKLDATDEEIIEAAKLANAHKFISHLPNGYDTLLTSDGEGLSAGQRQLIAIARAAVANPPVLILDEATSSIDTRTEKLIEEGMNKLMNGRTVFVIAHRLSTVRNADCIMVLENGNIIERGNHEKLLEEKGKYYELHRGMFELS